MRSIDTTIAFTVRTGSQYEGNEATQLTVRYTQNRLIALKVRDRFSKHTQCDVCAGKALG